MSRRSPKLELKLNLSPPTSSQRRMVRSPTRSATTSPTSPPSSCVSSEMNQDEPSVRYSTSPETTSMVLSTLTLVKRLFVNALYRFGLWSD
ncbi:PREDICTED: uncharacterized protein LOC109131138 [Camelina sativa]|uniref:Uncharacterized protein LOC109131138 n=1 Tax=Camelina sativa TaxID=90675 RepID=A0ABM1RE60_CAMSA|nr:PREDICTED: uncharacterized protein LOC109131138 [Camelina sativa]